MQQPNVQPLDAAQPIARLVGALGALAGAARAQVEAVLADAAAVRRWLDGVETAAAARLAALAAANPSIFPEQVAATSQRTDLRVGSRLVERAAAAAQVPAFAAAMQAGTVSGEHVDVVGRALAGLAPHDRPLLAAEGDRLADIAARGTPDELRRAVRTAVRQIETDGGVARLERQKRAVSLRSWTGADDGMVHLVGRFDPESGSALLGRLDHAVERLFHGATPDRCPTDPGARADFLRAHALLALTGRVGLLHEPASTDGGGAPVSGEGASCEHPSACGPPGDGSGGPPGHAADGRWAVPIVELSVVIDHRTLTEGWHEASRFEVNQGVELPLDTVRRFACIADIIPVLVNDDGVVTKLGRTVRLANRAQRRALRVMYPTCAVPGCTVRFDHCEPHHVVWFRRQGQTDLDNLLPLCSRHHHAAHEGGWHLVLDPATRVLAITTPDGTQFEGRPVTPSRRTTPRLATRSPGPRPATSLDPAVPP